LLKKFTIKKKTKKSNQESGDTKKSKPETRDTKKLNPVATSGRTIKVHHDIQTADRGIVPALMSRKM
jgi:hypothetical protein